MGWLCEQSDDLHDTSVSRYVVMMVVVEVGEEWTACWMKSNHFSKNLSLTKLSVCNKNEIRKRIVLILIRGALNFGVCSLYL